MQYLKPLCLSLALTFVASFALAQNGQVLEKRSVKQGERIEQGENSGALNDKEAARLEHRQGNIDKRIDHAQADGTVTRGEKRRITKAQNRENRAIKVQKHDRQHSRH